MGVLVTAEDCLSCDCLRHSLFSSYMDDITLASVKVLGLTGCAGVTNVCAQMPLPNFCSRSFGASCDVSGQFLDC